MKEKGSKQVLQLLTTVESQLGRSVDNLIYLERPANDDELTDREKELLEKERQLETAKAELDH